MARGDGNVSVKDAGDVSVKVEILVDVSVSDDGEVEVLAKVSVSDEVLVDVSVKGDISGGSMISDVFKHIINFIKQP